MKLTRRLVVPVALCVASGILLVAIFVRAKEDAKAQALTHQRMIAELAKNGLEEHFKFLVHLAEFLAANPDVAASNASGQQLLRHFYKAQARNIRNVTRTDVRGRIAFNHPDTRVIGAYIGDQAHVKTVFRTKKPTLSTVFRAVEGYETIALHVPVYRNGSFDGTLAFLIPFDEVGERYVGSVEFGPRGTAVLFDETGVILYSKDRARIGKAMNQEELALVLSERQPPNRAPAPGFALSRPNRGMLAGVGADEPVLSYTLPVHNQNRRWFVMVASPERDAVGYVSGFSTKWTLLILAAVVLFAVWGGVLTKAIATAQREEERRLANERILKAEREAQLAKALLVSGVDQSPAGIIIAEADTGKVLLINLAARACGCMAQAVSTEELDIFSPSTWKFVRPDGTPYGPGEAPLCRSLSNGETVVNEEAAVYKDNGEKEWYSIHSAPVLGAEGDIVAAITILQDVTARKEAEERLRDVNALLEQKVAERTAKMQESIAELEAFSYSVSHDLRAPLRSLAGFASILVEDYGGKLDEEGKHLLERIKHNAEAMSVLIDSLLQLSRISRTSLNKTEVSLLDLAGKAVEEVLGTGNYGDGRVEVDIPPDLVVSADANLITVALRNLVDNALKFSSKAPSPRVQIGAEREGGQVKVFVRDNGVGFKMEDADKLFTAFERLHTQHDFPGTGVGLTTVQRIVARHGGRVWAEGKEGEGATFWFSLPA